MFNWFKSKKQDERSDKILFSIMLVGGILALMAAFILTIEKFHLLENPEVALSCSFNLVVNCATVMQTPQASVFGFPNSMIGLMAFPVIILIATLGLWKVQFPKLFLKLTNVGYLLGTVFAYWLFFQSVYVIQVLCPWCLFVTFSTTLILASMTHYNLRYNTFGFNKKANEHIQNFLKKGYHTVVVVSWLVLLTCLVFIKFGSALFA